ncbi:hypothetical protein BJ875DRAFT_465509 [Amylocarpus encephaloides]|uniref:Uncharacterized protein n=1 Tax=Amylocarpus encephaloides TaxID=45428 RepID=A0A9P8C3Y1_9HELO|nr:hypothetical protein BJ875DRAFT_465509 [Amylocarpus encephaloides]
MDAWTREVFLFAASIPPTITSLTLKLNTPSFESYPPYHLCPLLLSIPAASPSPTSNVRLLVKCPCFRGSLPRACKLGPIGAWGSWPRLYKSMQENATKHDSPLPSLKSNTYG